MSLDDVFSEATYPYRVLAGTIFFLVLGVYDLRKHPENPRRAKEYLFLFVAMVLAVVYGVVHDQITATISPEYFIFGKLLDFDPPPFRWAVARLAAKASYGVGLLAGAFLLIANNPSKKRQQLPYRELLRLVLLPLGAAALGAAIGGLLYSFDLFHQRPRVSYFVDKPDIPRFLIVWGIHTGSYVGGGAGTLAAVVVVLARRRRRRIPEPVVT